MNKYAIKASCFAFALVFSVQLIAANGLSSNRHSDELTIVEDTQLTWREVLQSAWSRSILVAQSQAEIAQGQAVNAIGKRLFAEPPALEASYLKDKNEGDRTKETEAALVLPLWQFGERSAYRQLGSLMTETAQFSHQAARLDVALAVVDVMHKLQSSLIKYKTQQSNTELFSGLVRDVENRVKAGDLATTDLRLAEAAWADAKLELLSADHARHDAIIDWQRLTGFQKIPLQPYPTMDDELVTTHPAIKAAITRIKQVEAESLVARKAQYSPIEISLRVRQETSPDFVSDQQAIGVGFRLPIGKSARGSLVHAAAQQQVMIAEKTLDDTHRLIEAKRQKALHEWQLQQARVEVAEARRVAMEERTLLLKKAFAAGERELSELLRAVHMLTEAQAISQQTLIDAELHRAHHLILNGFLP